MPVQKNADYCTQLWTQQGTNEETISSHQGYAEVREWAH